MCPHKKVNRKQEIKLALSENLLANIKRKKGPFGFNGLDELLLKN